MEDFENKTSLLKVMQENAQKKFCTWEALEQEAINRLVECSKIKKMHEKTLLEVALKLGEKQ